MARLQWFPQAAALGSSLQSWESLEINCLLAVLLETNCCPMCVRNVDCGGGLVCADGQCRAPCDGAGQCPGDDVCVDRVCVDPVEAAPECADSAGCVGALICRDARCVAWP